MQQFSSQHHTMHSNMQMSSNQHNMMKAMQKRAIQNASIPPPSATTETQSAIRAGVLSKAMHDRVRAELMRQMLQD